MSAQCEKCGRFYSDRTAKDHAWCQRALDQEESGLHETYGVVQGRSS